MALEEPKLREFLGQPLSALELAEPTLISPTSSLADAIAAMRDRHDSCALIAEDGTLRGIITERDVLFEFVDESVDWEQPVQAVMTAGPASIDHEESIGAAIRLMRERDFRTVPIVDGGSVRGLVRLADLIRNIAELFPEEILNLPPRANQQMKAPEGG